MDSTRIAVLAVAAGAFLAGCGGPTSQPSEVEPSGPPVLREDVVQKHAAQFDSELADRRAGSQQEQGASQYVLGHLQQAGYFVRLESVPVGDLVETTNLLALPPSGEQPHTIVAVAYDAYDSIPSGEAVGTFLELARALYSAQRGHAVEFAGLAAEASENHLGSRRLAQQLREDESSVRVITIVPGSEEVGATGDLLDEFESAAQEEGVELGPPPDQKIYELDVFARAGFESLVVAGPPAELGTVLLALLQESPG